MQTCKLFFPVDTPVEDVRQLVADQTDGKGVVHNFYPKKKIGRNTVAFAVVSVPLASIVGLKDHADVSDLEQMLEFAGTGQPTADDGCGGGGCGGGGGGG